MVLLLTVFLQPVFTMKMIIDDHFWVYGCSCCFQKVSVGELVPGASACIPRAGGLCVINR